MEYKAFSTLQAILTFTTVLCDFKYTYAQNSFAKTDDEVRLRGGRESKVRAYENDGKIQYALGAVGKLLYHYFVVK